MAAAVTASRNRLPTLPHPTAPPNRPHSRPPPTHTNRKATAPLAFVDLQALVADLKDHLGNHGFHIHDEKHYVETYSLLQSWEIEMHPEDACGGGVELSLTMFANPRTLLALEDVMTHSMYDGELPPDEYWAPVEIAFNMPPLDHRPDMVALTAAIAPFSSAELPLTVAALDSVSELAETPQQFVSIKGTTEISLLQLLKGELDLCETLDKLRTISNYLTDQADRWINGK